MKIRNIILAFTLLLGLVMVSCEGSFDFNKEQYKKVVYIMGGNEGFNIFNRTVLNLDQQTDTMYITVGVGGTNAPDKDIKVTIEEADSLFNAYNKSNFDIDTAQFAKILSPDFYTIASKTAVIKAGTSTAKIPVILKDLDKLSPDTTYFLNYKIGSVDTSLDKYEISKEYNQAMYRIYYKNKWATTKKTKPYSAIAFSLGLNNNPGNDTILMSVSPKVFPLTKNSVRVTVGKFPFEKLEDINAYSFVIEVDENPIYTTDKTKTYKIQIKKYKDMSVEQLDPVDSKNLYNNTFVDLKKQVSPGVFIYFKVFKVRFKYRYQEKDDDGNFKNEYTTRIIEERLKLQYNPKAEL